MYIWQGLFHSLIRQTFYTLTLLSRLLHDGLVKNALLGQDDVEMGLLLHAAAEKHGDSTNEVKSPVAQTKITNKFSKVLQASFQTILDQFPL